MALEALEAGGETNEQRGQRSEMIRQTNTYAILHVSPAAYAEIRAKLKAAQYDQAFR